MTPFVWKKQKSIRANSKTVTIASMGTSECRDPNAANGWLTHLMEMRSRGNPAKGRHCGACG
jgi:hypothetical protein